MSTTTATTTTTARRHRTPRHSLAYPVTLAEQDAISAVAVTLNDKPARVQGFRNRFATVYQIDSIHTSAEYTWETVLRIALEGNGAFRA